LFGKQKHQENVFLVENTANLTEICKNAKRTLKSEERQKHNFRQTSMSKPTPTAKPREQPGLSLGTNRQKEVLGHSKAVGVTALWIQETGMWKD
jgi:hypothetical protein